MYCFESAMKKIIPCLIILLLTSCLAEQDNPLIVPTCFDGIKNQNETEIDCGGKCAICIVEPPFVVPCKSTLVNNQVTVNGLKINLTSSNLYCNQETGYYEIHILNPTYDITIEISGSTPPYKNKKYPLVPDYNLESGYASITVINFYRYVASSGYLYVTVENGKIIAELCSVSAIGPFGSYSISGRILCN
jgi:hypothetical protein